MRILHLVSYSLFSGPLPPTLALARGQLSQGHTVWLAYDTKRGAFNSFEEAAAPHVTADLCPPITLELSAKSSPWRMGMDVWRLRRFCRAHGVDVVHTHLSHDHLLATLCGPQPAIHVRTVHAARSLTGRFLQGAILRRADGFIVRCGAHGDSLRQRLSPHPKPLSVVGGSIDPSYGAALPDGRAVRQGWGIDPQVPLIGHVALLQDRGQLELMGALAHCPRLHGLFVGRGVQEPQLRAAARLLGVTDRVHFVGYLPGAALLQAYAAMDAAFLGRPGNDGSARAALEAMACGLPVLAVQTEVLGELVTPARGYPVAACSVAAILAAVQRWLADFATAETLARAGKNHVRAACRIDVETALTLQLYERALTHRAPPSGRLEGRSAGRSALVAQRMDGRRYTAAQRDETLA